MNRSRFILGAGLLAGLLLPMCTMEATPWAILIQSWWCR